MVMVPVNKTPSGGETEDEPTLLNSAPAGLIDPAVQLARMKSVVTSKQAEADFINGARQAEADPDTGIVGYTGKEGSARLGVTQAKIGAMGKKLAEAMPYDARQQFYRKVETQTERIAKRHITQDAGMMVQQLRETFDNKRAALREEVMANLGDAEAMQGYASEIDQEIDEQAQYEGWSPDEIVNRKAVIRAGMHKDVILATADDNPFAALEHMNANRDAFSTEDLDRYEEPLKQMAQEREDQRIVAEILGGSVAALVN